ncbi:MAG: hypothetical protein H8Z69_04010 [Nanohaloarchaea archaeon]|nr:hypothetical protein [Candidatus Nanohaloarchaea archaeon]
MRVREARKKDVEGISEIAEKTWMDSYSSIISESTIQKVIDDCYDLDSLEYQLDKGLFYVAEEDNEVIGFAHAGSRRRK